MKLLEERIRKDGVVKEGNILKVDSFLNHQMDVALFNKMGEEFKLLFADRPINKILTIEASGIGIAAIVAQHFNVPVVFAKKAQSVNLDGTMYDFLANGCAVDGLIELIRSAGATVEGVGIVIEKGQQSGGKLIRDKGIRVESLAIIESMDPSTGEIVFREQKDAADR